MTHSSPDSATLTELADAIVGIQEDVPSVRVRDILGMAAHYLRKFAARAPAKPQRQSPGSAEAGTIFAIGGAGSGLGYGCNAIEVRESTGGAGWKWRKITDVEKLKLLEALNAHTQCVQQPAAFVPVHPRQGPLWSDTIAAGSDLQRSENYPRMPLYAAPPQAATYTEVCKSKDCPRGGRPVEIVGSAIKAMQARNLTAPPQAASFNLATGERDNEETDPTYFHTAPDVSLAGVLDNPAVPQAAPTLEECAKVADDFANAEKAIMELAFKGTLSEAGRTAVIDHANQRRVMALQIAQAIRALARPEHKGTSK